MYNNWKSLKIAETIYTPFQRGHFWPVPTISCNFLNFVREDNSWNKLNESKKSSLSISCIFCKKNNRKLAQNKNIWMKIYFINGSILVLTKVYWELKSNNLQANIATIMSAHFPCNRHFSPIKMVKDWKLFYRKIIKSKTAFKMAKK